MRSSSIIGQLAQLAGKTQEKSAGNTAQDSKQQGAHYGAGVSHSIANRINGGSSRNETKALTRTIEDEVYNALTSRLNQGSAQGRQSDSVPAEKATSREDEIYKALTADMGNQSRLDANNTRTNDQRDKLLGDLQSLRDSSGFITDDLTRANFDQTEQKILADLAAWDTKLGNGPQDYSAKGLAEASEKNRAAAAARLAEEKAQKAAREDAEIRARHQAEAVEAEKVLDYYDNAFNQRQFWTPDDWNAYNKAQSAIMNRDAGKVNIPGLIKNTIDIGLTEADKAIADTADFVAGGPLEEIWTLLGITANDLTGKDIGDNPLQRYRAKEAEVQAANREAAEQNANGNTTASKMSNYGAMAVQAIPASVLAVMSGGTSTGAQASSEALQAASALAQGSKAAQMIKPVANTAARMIKDPNWLNAFATSAGPSYQDALNRGATEDEATMYALLNGVFNATVEVGGGDEEMGGLQSLPAEVRQAIESGDPSIALSVLRSIPSEIGEEVVQGIGESGLRSTYDPNVELFSTENEDAIINPNRMLDEAKGAAIVAALLGGGQAAIQAGINSAANAQNSKNAPHAKTAQDALLEAAGIMQNQQAAETPQNAQGVAGDIPAPQTGTESGTAAPVELNTQERPSRFIASVREKLKNLVLPNERKAVIDRMSFGEQVAAIENGAITASEKPFVDVSATTPQTLIDKAGAEQLPVIMSYENAYLSARDSGKQKGHYHDLGADIMSQIPAKMDEPLAIIRQKNGRIAEVLPLTDKQGKNIYAIVELNATKDVGGINKAYNLIISAFGAGTSYIQGQINKKGNEVIENNLPGATSQVNPQRIELPGTINEAATGSAKSILSSNENIPQPAPNSNSQSQNSGADSGTQNRNGQIYNGLGPARGPYWDVQRRVTNEEAAAKTREGQLERYGKENAPEPVKAQKARDVARQLQRDTGTSMKLSEIQAELQSLADYVSSNNDGQGVSSEDLNERISELAHKMVQTTTVDGESGGDPGVYNALREYLRTTNIAISNELRGDITDFADWRRRNSGKLRLRKSGQAIDSVYQELSETMGEGLFPPDITAHSDQLNRILEVLDMSRPDQVYWYDTVSGEEYDAAVQALSDDIREAVTSGQITSTASDPNMAEDSGFWESLDGEAPPDMVERGTTWDEKADAQKHADRLRQEAADTEKQAEKYRKMADAMADPDNADAYRQAAEAAEDKARRLRKEAADTEIQQAMKGEPEKEIVSSVEARGRERESGYNRNIRTDENRHKALRKMLEDDPQTYRQLGNKDTLAAAQEIFMKGQDEALRTLETALDAAEAGRKLAPEMLPLQKMLSDELTQMGDVYKAQELANRVGQQLIEAGQLGQAARILRKSEAELLSEQAYKALSDEPESRRMEVAQALAEFAGRHTDSVGKKMPGDSYTDAELADLRQLAKDLNDYRKTGTFIPKNFGKLLDSISDGAYLDQFVSKQMLAIIDDASTKTTDNIGGKVKTMQVLSQLTSLATTERNLVGNFSFGAIDLFTADTVGFAVDSLVSKFTGKKTVGFDKGWFSSKARSAGKDAFLKSVLEIAADVNMNNQSSKYSLSTDRTFKANGGTFSRAMSRWEQLLGYALTSTDRLSRGKTEAGTSEALRNLKNSNLSEEEIADIAKQDADYRLFQNEGLAATASQGAHDLLNLVGVGGEVNGAQRKGGFGLGDLVNTYPKVPANLGVKLLEHSPLNTAKGLAELAWNAHKGTLDAAKQHQAVMDISRGLTGTALITAFAAIAKSGALRDFDDEDDYDVMAQNTAEGKRGLQWNVTATLEGRPNDWRNGDMLVSAAFMEPVDGFLRAGVMIANEDDADFANISGDILEAAAQSVADLPVLSNLSNIEDTLRYSTAETAGGKIADAAATFAGDAVGGFIPAPIRHLANATDSKARDTTSNSKPRAALNRILNNIPGLRETLDVKTDAFGQQISNGSAAQRAANMVLPGRVDTINQSRASAAVEALIEATGKKSLMPDRKGPKSLDIGGETVKLTDEQSREYKETLGAAYSEAVEALLRNKTWGMMSEEAQVKTAQDIIAMSRDAAKMDVAKRNRIEYESDWADERALRNPATYLAVKNMYSLAASDKNGKRDYKAIDALLKTSGRYAKLDEASKALLQENTATAYLDELFAAHARGIDAKAWFQAKDQQKAINAQDLTSTQKAVAFSNWLDNQSYTDQQKQTLQEQMGFYSQVRGDSDKYDSLVDSGLSSDNARNLYDAIYSLPILEGSSGVKNAQKYRAINDASYLSEAEKWAALEQYGTEAAIRDAKRYKTYAEWIDANGKYVRLAS